MLNVSGKHATAIVYTDNLDEKSMSQISELCDQEFLKDSKIRIMPDVHAGIGCTIGTTMTIKDKIVPNLVGVDIGCGLEVSRLEHKKINLKRLDKIIRKNIPSGFNVRSTTHEYLNNVDLSKLKCKKHLDLGRAKLSIGTLGGGNHFIEVNKDDEDNIYLIVHSGSRNLGKQVAEYYQNVAYEESKKVKGQKSRIKKDLAYLTGEGFNDYINDMKIIQMYAVYNRKAITDEILKEMNLSIKEHFTTIHNYIDLKNMILRKGAISAQKGEKVIIPLNMRDGSIIAIGKGNPNWNYSAPHGAGRIMSRTKAKKSVSLKKFKESMEGVYSTSVNKSTIDEAPMVYKPMEEIIDNIKETVEIESIIKPIYNFKAN